MTDEQLPDSLAEDDALYDEDGEGGRRSRGLIWILLAIAIVIIVLLLLRDCGGHKQDTAASGKKSIESVSGMQPSDGLVSVWISNDTNLDAALGGAGVNASDRIDLGGGRYVVSVENGAEDSAVKKLTATEGVYDAGRVYERKSK